MSVWVSFLAIVLLAVPGRGFAAPFLISDPYPKSEEQPTEFELTVGNRTFKTPAEVMSDKAVRLHFDLSQLPDGEHVVAVKAVNPSKREESEAVSLKISKNGKEVTLIPLPKHEPASEKRAATQSPQGQQPATEKRGPSRAIRGLLRP
jgi:hypothetical protein